MSKQVKKRETSYHVHKRWKNEKTSADAFKKQKNKNDGCRSKCLLKLWNTQLLRVQCCCRSLSGCSSPDHQSSHQTRSPDAQPSAIPTYHQNHMITMYEIPDYFISSTSIFSSFTLCSRTDVSTFCSYKNVGKMKENDFTSVLL